MAPAPSDGAGSGQATQGQFSRRANFTEEKSHGPHKALLRMASGCPFHPCPLAEAWPQKVLCMCLLNESSHCRPLLFLLPKFLRFSAYSTIFDGLGL